MKKIYIVGGDGFARECYLNLLNTEKYGKEIIFGGFLGHGGYGKTVDYKSYQHLYIGEITEHQFDSNDYMIIGAGYPYLRKKIYKDLKMMGLQFYNLISNGVILPKSFEYGEANVFIPPFYSSVNIKIGNCNVFNCNIILGHDATIGDYNFFGPSSQVLGYAQIGNENQIGANCVILPNVKIGDNNKIAPLSAIYKGCKNNCYMSGNPALKVGEVE